MVQLTWRNGLDEAEVGEVMSLLRQASETDGVDPVGEHVVLRLRARRTVQEQIEPVQGDVGGSEHFVAREAGGELVGYAHLDTTGAPGEPLVAELAVLPRARRRGTGERLVRTLLDRAELSPERPGGEQPGGERRAEPQRADPREASGSADRLRVWSHGEHPGALRLAERFGFARSRELWRMLLEDGGELPVQQVPAGVRIRAFVPGADERELVEVNHRAFSWHPEQGGMTVDELRQKERAEWFDPTGFLLAESVPEHGSAARLLGFHWTKVHPDGTGEVYVIGVDPAAQGGGLGRALTLAGLHHLRDSGIGRIMLYVEGDNGPAIAVYRRLGFERRDVDVQFGR